MPTEALRVTIKRVARSMFEPYNPKRKRQSLDVGIRDATEADITSVMEISMARDPGDPAVIESSLRSYLANRQESILLLAIVDGQIVGFGKAKKYRREKTAYPGWYLTGLIVIPGYRNAGIGTQLTIVRLDEISHRAGEAYYFVNAANRVSIELHQKLGFELVQDHFEFPGVTFSNSHGQLYRKQLR